MPAITDQDGNVAQVTPDGALVVTGSGVAAPPVELKIVDGVDTAKKAEVDASKRVRVYDVPVETAVTGVSTKLDELDDQLAFLRVLKFEPLVGEEIRRDETLTDDYHGVAPDGSLTSAAVWSVARFYKTAGLITRVRYRTGVVWDNRAVGW